MIFYSVIDKLSQQSWFPWLVVTPLYYAVGNACEEVYFGQLCARKRNKKLIILTPFPITELLGYKLCNKPAFNLESDHTANGVFDKIFIFFLRLYLTVVFFITRFIALRLRKQFNINLSEEYYFPRIGIADLWVPKGMKSFSWEEVDKLEWDKEFASFLDIRLPLKWNRKCEDNAKEMGIFGKDFITIHVREGGFRNDHDRRPYRNADIYNYLPAIKKLIERGYIVVRLGDDTMKRMPEMEGLIDYPFTKYKSAEMDMYLLKHNSHFIGMHSGVTDTALMFQVPVHMVNMYNWTHGWPYRKRDRGLLKHFYSRQLKRFLSVEELVTGSWRLQNTEGYVGSEYDIYDNTAEELEASIMEFIDEGENQTELQVEATRVRAEYSKALYVSEDCKKGENIKDLPLLEQYRYASRIFSARGAITNTFLQDNWKKNSKDISIDEGPHQVV